MDDTFRIVPLSNKTLEAASQLTVDVFKPKKSDLDYPPEVLASSLSPEENTYDSKYWVAVQSGRDVAGLIGTYDEDFDSDIAAWMGWYCVDPNSRGLGVGSSLLNHLLSTIQGEGKEFVRLYTDPRLENERLANEMYLRRGFVPMKDKDIDLVMETPEIREYLGGYSFLELKLK